MALFFYLTWSIFELVRAIIKANIMTIFQEYWAENVAYLT